MSLFAEPRFVDDLSTCFFYHTMDVPGYGLQSEPWDLRGKFREYIGHVDVRDKRVLDIGSQMLTRTYSPCSASTSSAR